MAKIIFIVTAITFKVAVSSSVTKIFFEVAEITFKVASEADISLLVAKITFPVSEMIINPLNADPEYTRGQKMSPCRGTPSILGCRVCFFVFLSVKSMWSDNHEGSLVFASLTLK